MANWSGYQSQSLGTLYAYASGNEHGKYTCTLYYLSVTRSGTTVTMNDANLYMYHNTDGSKYTTNRIACKAGIGGSQTNIKNNYTINSSGSNSKAEYTISLGSPSITTTDTSFSFYLAVASTGSNSGWTNFIGNSPVSKTFTISCPAAGSAMGSVTAGTTLSGPTINVTKYDNSFTDNITLTYNGYTITRNSFTSSKLVFTEAERLDIYKAHGNAGGQTRSWSISGTTKSGNTTIGTFSGSVNITTEALSTVSAAANFNVGSSTTYSTTNACGGKSRVIAYVLGYGNTAVYDSDKFTGTKSGQSCTPTASSIYSSNTTSKTGTVYWRIYSYINDVEVGYIDNRTCTYTFVQSSCGPSLSKFQYAINDAGTRALMSSAGSYYNYNTDTDKGKFIKSKTTLNIKAAGSSQQNAKISSMWLEVAGQSNSNFSIGSNITSTGDKTLTTAVLTSSGSISVGIRDTRGFETKLSFSFTLNDYYLPSFTSVTAVRNAMSSSDSTVDKIVKISASISIPSYMITYIKNNTSTYYLKYRYSTDGTNWTTDSTNLLSQTANGTNKITLTDYATGRIFDQNTKYYLQLLITEYYSSSSPTYSVSVNVPISAPLISRRPQKVGINKIPTNYTLDVGGTFGCDGNATINGNIYAKGDIHIDSEYALKGQHGASWYQGRSRALLYNYFTGTSASYFPMVSSKTKNGDWAIGTYGADDSLRAIYTTDTNYNASQNSVGTIYFPSAPSAGSSKTLATTADIPTNVAHTNVNNNFSTSQTISGNLSANNVTAGSGYLYSTCTGKQIQIGSQNASWCHYSTGAPAHWFNKNVYVQGDIYGGSGYDKLVAYSAQLPAWAGTSNNYTLRFAKTGGNTYGVQIAFIRYATSQKISNTWGSGMYTCSAFDLPNYANAFAAVPMVSLFVEGASSAIVINSGTDGTAAKPPKIQLARGSSMSSAGSFTISVIAVGYYS